MIEGLLYEYRDGLVAIKSGHIKRVIPVVAHGGKALYVLCSYAWVVRPRISSKFLNHGKKERIDDGVKCVNTLISTWQPRGMKSG
jgi:hypothetical protein